jgi:hypothetical protein
MNKDRFVLLFGVTYKAQREEKNSFLETVLMLTKIFSRWTNRIGCFRACSLILSSFVLYIYEIRLVLMVHTLTVPHVSMAGYRSLWQIFIYYRPALIDTLYNEA